MQIVNNEVCFGGSTIRAFGAAATLAVALILVACGGGGGGEMTEVAAVPTGAVSALSAKASRASAATKVLNADDLMNWAEVTFPQYFSPSAQSTVVRDGFVFRYYPVTENYLAVTNGATNDIYALGKTTEGKLIKVGALANFTCAVYLESCQPAAWWPPKTITPIGVKVIGANRLPATCLSAYVSGTQASGESQCWKDAIADGTVKIIATDALMTGYTGTSNGHTDNATRPVVFVYFVSGNGNWNTLILYRDEGKLIGSDISGGGSSEVDWVYGTTKGLIMHEKSSGSCYEMTWYPPSIIPGVGSNVWSVDQPVTCPL